jgi:hypothetical protein
MAVSNIEQMVRTSANAPLNHSVTLVAHPWLTGDIFAKSVFSIGPDTEQHLI